MHNRGFIIWKVYGPAKANWSDTGFAAGSAYVDVAIIDLDTTVEWWMEVGGSSAASCHTKSAVPSLKTQGYPYMPILSDFGVDYPHIAYGSLEPIDFCDDYSDSAWSSDMYLMPGMSGGPLTLAYSHSQVAVNSGMSYDTKNESCHYKSAFAPLDNYNMGMFNGINTLGTLWSRTSKRQ
jgi:hypothetical protein